MRNVEVLLSPAELATLPRRDLSRSACVVFDILRATSTMMTALAGGAASIIPVAEIGEAVALREADPAVLLAGERHGLRILGDQTGGIDFDLGNSPREFTADAVRGKTIVMTTTNGTRALRACATAETILIGSFFNMPAVAKWIRARAPEELLLICAGTFEEAAYEDVLAAGNLCDLIGNDFISGTMADSAQIALKVWRAAQQDPAGAMPFSKNARRLIENADLREDVPFCLRQNILEFVAEMRDGRVMQRFETR